MPLSKKSFSVNEGFSLKKILIELIWRKCTFRIWSTVIPSSASLMINRDIRFDLVLVPTICFR